MVAIGGGICYYFYDNYKKAIAEEELRDSLRRMREAENARCIYELLGSPKSVFLNIAAKSPRELAAMAANCTAYFGNEGGGRHIVHAMGKPSLVICSPYASKTTWLPQDTDIIAQGIDATSYDQITIEHVWSELEQFCKTTTK